MKLNHVRTGCGAGGSVQVAQAAEEQTHRVKPIIRRFELARNTPSPRGTPVRHRASLPLPGRPDDRRATLARKATMLGFSPISATPIAGLSSVITAVSAPMSATGGITFGGSANPVFTKRMSATGGLTFSGTATAFWTQDIHASGGITFSGTARLILSGRPLKFVALADNYTFVAERVNFEFVGVAENYVFKGVLQ